MAALNSIAAPLPQGPVVPTRRPTQTATATPRLTDTPTDTPTSTPTETPAATDTPTDLPTATNSPTPATPVVEAVRSMTLRGGPGQLFPVVATLEPSAQLDIIGISEDGQWYQVLLEDGTPAWVSSSTAMVTTFGDLRSVPLALPPTNTPTETATNTATQPPTDTPTNTPTATATSPAPPTPSTEAVAIELGDTMTGSISRTAFEARYTFEGQEGDAVDIRLSNVSGDLDPLLILLGVNGQEIIRNDDDPNGFNRDSHIANFRLPETGTYTIIATRFQQAQGISEGEYSLTLSEGGAAPPPTPEGATPAGGTGTIAYGETVTGSLQGATNEVRYTFTAQPGDVIDIRMNNASGNLDPLLILYGPNGREIARDDDSGGNFNAYIQGFAIQAPGMYSIAATRFGTSEGSFSLTLTLAGSGPVSSPPPGGNVINIGQTVNGQISGPNGAVNYTFNGQAGSVIEIRINNVSGDLDPLLILLGPNGQEVARDDDGGGARNAYIRSLTLPANGIYTIVATRFGEETGSSQGEFSLSLQGSGGIVATPPTGDSLTYGQTVQGSVPEGANTQANYTFSGQAGDVVEIRMTRTNGQLDPLLILLGPNGQEVARDDDGGGSRNAYIRTLTLPASGVYTITATKFGTAGGEFSLSLELVTAGSNVSTPVSPGGSTITAGNPVTGNISAGNPQVSYSFNGEAGQVIGVRMYATSGDLDSVVILYDPAGREVADNDDDEIGKNFDSYLRDFVLPESGVYTVVATRYQQAEGDTSGDFELILVNGSDLDRPLNTFDSLSPVSSLAVGDTVSGTITANDYVRLYSLAGNAGQTITISMVSPNQSVDTYLILLAPDGREIARNDDATTETIDSEISGVSLPANGTYTIVATRYLQQAGNSAGDFDLSVTAGGTPGGVVEQGIEYNSSRNGTIDDERYMYVFTFQGDAGDAVNIEMTPTSGDLLTVLMLTDNMGNIIATDLDLTNVESSIQGFSLPANGFYSIVAMRYRADIGGTSGNFALELSGG
jgi:hypothetical protein